MMNWNNIKDYQFEKDTYISEAKVDEEIPSLNQQNIENFSFDFPKSCLDSVLTREYAKSLAAPIQQGEYIYCDSMEQLKEFCLLYMMRLSDVFLRLREPDIENAGSSIKDLMAQYDEYIKETGNNYKVFQSVKNFLFSLPSKKEAPIKVKNEYLDQYYPYYADALKSFLCILATIFNYNLKQPDLPSEKVKLYAQRGYDRNFIVKDEAKLKKFLENFEEEYCFAEQEVRSVFEPPFSDIELKSLGFNNLCLHLKNMNISSSEENDNLFRFIDYVDIRTVIFENCAFSGAERLFLRDKSFMFKNCIFNCRVSYWETGLNRNFQTVISLLKFENCIFNGNFEIDKIQKGCYSALILRNCTFSEQANFLLSNISKLKIIFSNTIFGGKVSFSDVNFHYGQIVNVIFLNELRVKNITFTKHVNFKQIVFSANVVKTMSNSIRSLVKALESSGFSDYAAELSEFYLNDLDSAKKQEAFDIAARSNWLNIKQTAAFLGISYTTLLAMRKEDKAGGVRRIPYIGEGKNSRYYLPLLEAYKSQNWKLVSELAKEIEGK